ncbi:chitosanase [Streptomyces sp. KM273126]|uniref:chitosanase n=1 Tax=Streptomyces sp. KM273126 TaxID=2545247 RepID=UPI00104052B0|nr:chitosanase [Streptomyces sp. KM273126]MBA2811998.1 chitosanase [Streptomyces sp. KM273126]
MFAAAPLVITAAVHVFTPESSAPDSPGSLVSASQQARQDAKARAEAKAEREAEAEREADEKVIAAAPPGLAAPDKKQLAQKLVASAENSTLDWRTTYGSIEDAGDGCGCTAGIIGLCTGTNDLRVLVERHTKSHPHDGLAAYLPALREVDGTDSHEGLAPGFTKAWQAEAKAPAFRKAQDSERDRVYFDPAVRLAELDGLGTLGQFVYYDAMVHHGPGTGPDGFYGLRERALQEADTPAEGGREKVYLDVFLDIRRTSMKSADPDLDTTRIDTAQRRFVYDGNPELRTPLVWQVYGETFRVAE